MGQRAIFVDEVLGVHSEENLTVVVIRTGAYEYHCCLSLEVATALHAGLVMTLMRDYGTRMTRMLAADREGLETEPIHVAAASG